MNQNPYNKIKFNNKISKEKNEKNTKKSKNQNTKIQTNNKIFENMEHPTIRKYLESKSKYGQGRIKKQGGGGGCENNN